MRGSEKRLERLTVISTGDGKRALRPIQQMDELKDEEIRPRAPELVGVKDGVVAEDGKILGLGLGNQHAVEGILVRAGEKSGAGGVSRCNWERFEEFRGEDFVETEREINGVREFSDAGFRGDFPCGGGTHQNSVGAGADKFSRGRRECMLPGLRWPFFSRSG